MVIVIDIKEPAREQDQRYHGQEPEIFELPFSVFSHNTPFGTALQAHKGLPFPGPGRIVNAESMPQGRRST